MLVLQHELLVLNRRTPQLLLEQRLTFFQLLRPASELAADRVDTRLIRGLDLLGRVLGALKRLLPVAALLRVPRGLARHVRALPELDREQIRRRSLHLRK